MSSIVLHFFLSLQRLLQLSIMGDRKLLNLGKSWQALIQKRHCRGRPREGVIGSCTVESWSPSESYWNLTLPQSLKIAFRILLTKHSRTHYEIPFFLFVRSQNSMSYTQNYTEVELFIITIRIMLAPSTLVIETSS